MYTLGIFTLYLNRYVLLYVPSEDTNVQCMLVYNCNNVGMIPFTDVSILDTFIKHIYKQKRFVCANMDAVMTTRVSEPPVKYNTLFRCIPREIGMCFCFAVGNSQAVMTSCSRIIEYSLDQTNQ